MKAQEIIKEIMKSEGLSQYALSSMCAMKRTTLQTVLLDDRDMTCDTISRIVSVLRGEFLIGGHTEDAITAIKLLMSEKGETQASLARKSGYQSRQAVGSLLQNKSVRASVLVKLVHAMGEKVVIRHNGEEWEVE